MWNLNFITREELKQHIKNTISTYLLPELQRSDNTYFYDDIPARLADNIKSGYSKMYNWDDAMRNFKAIIDDAFENRIKLKDNIDNSRKQMQNNTTGFN